MCMYII